MQESKKQWWEPGSKFEQRFIKSLLTAEGIVVFGLLIYALAELSKK